MVTVRSFVHTTHQHLSSVVYKRKATSPYLQISTIKTEKCSNTARDIKRRLEVITMKMEDLKKLGVSCICLQILETQKLWDSFKAKHKRYWIELILVMRVRTQKQLTIQTSVFLYLQFHYKN